MREGLLFVWPSPGPEAFIHSAAVQPPGSKVFAQVSPGVALSHVVQCNGRNTQGMLHNFCMTASSTASVQYDQRCYSILCAEDVTAEHTMYFQRDFPVPYDIVVENIGDQSHVPFAHHGVAGNRYC